MTSNSPDTQIEPTAEDHLGFGAKLRAARLAKGLSIDDCVQELHLPARRLQQLEAGNYRGQIDSVYLRGYLLKYGRLVGLDEGSIASELASLTVSAPELVVSGAIPPMKYHLERYARVATYLVLTAVIVVPVAWLGLRGSLSHNIDHFDTLDAQPVAQQDTVAPPVSPQAKAAPITAAVTSAVLAQGGAASPAAPSAPAQATVSTLAAAGSSHEVASSGQQAPAAAQAQPPLMAAMIPQPLDKPSAGAATDSLGRGAHSLTLSLSQTSWVEVSSPQGGRLAYGLLPADSSKTFRSDQGFTVRIGNASGARVDLDGQPLALDGYRHANVARFRVAVQDGKAAANAF